MKDIVYAENSSMGLLTPENAPETLQHSFEEELKKQKEIVDKCSEDSFTIKSTINELKKGFKDGSLDYEAVEKIDKMSSEAELRAFCDKERQNASGKDGAFSDVLSYADVKLQQLTNKKEQDAARQEIQQLSRYSSLSRDYGEGFSYLYQIQSNAEKQDNDGQNANVRFNIRTMDMPQNSGIMTQIEKIHQDALGGFSSTLALDVQIEGGVPFSLTVKPYDEQDNETQKKVQLSFSEQAIQQLTSGSEEENKAKIEQIYKFCADNGLPTADMTFPMDRDGRIHIDEKLKNLLAEVKEKINEENRKVAQEEDTHRQEDLTREGKSSERDEEGELQPSEQETSGINLERDVDTETKDNGRLPEPSNINTPEQTNDAQGNPPPHHASRRPSSSGSQKSAEEVFEDMIENDLGRQEGRSYFKRSNDQWRVYILYDKDVRHNRPVEQDKKGNIQYNYSLKLYVHEDKNGILHLSYRTPNGKKLDEMHAGAMAGKLKDLKVTHFRIPKGWRADDIGTWRIALAEKGIVPTGIGLDRVKAEKMLDAAKKKLSAEAYDKYKARLGEQMLRHNREKGKHPEPSEQAFIDGLVATRDFGAFVGGYGECLKSKMRRNFRTATGDYNAVDKIANFRSLRRLYDLYKDSLGQENILASNLLTPAEKQAAANAGLTGNVRDLRPDQIGTLFDILQTQSKVEIEQKLDTALSMLYDPPAGRRRDTRPARTIINQVLTDEKDLCKDIVDDLLANGQDEIKLTESVGNMTYDYESRHPQPVNPKIMDNVQTSQASEKTASPMPPKKTTTKVNSGVKNVTIPKGPQREM